MNNRKTKHLVVTLTFLLTVFTLSCKQEKKDATRKKHVLEIGIQNNVVSTLILIAGNKGFFKEENLKVIIRPFSSGKIALKNLLENKVDLADSSDIPIMKACFNHHDLRILTTIATTANGVWILARKDHKISKPLDLLGKKIATQKNSAVHYFLSMFLLMNGINESDCEIIFLPANKLPQAIIKGDVDAISMRNPFINQAKKELGNKTVEFFDSTAYFQTFNIVAKEATLKKNPEAIKSFLKALIKAENLVTSNPQEAQNCVINQLGSERKQEVLDDWSRYNYHLNLSQGLLLTLDQEAKWLKKTGQLTDRESPNYYEKLYIKPLKEIAPLRVKIAGE